MPHSLIAKLHTLQALVPQGDALEKEVVVGEGSCPELHDRAYELIDEIQTAARSLFGGDAPSSAQDRAMSAAGFSVHWRRGLIRLSRGYVRYKV